MSSLTKSLSVLAIGGILAGTAFAGPNDAYAGYPAVSFAKANAEKKTNETIIALLFRPRAKSVETKTKAQKFLIHSANPKMPGVVAINSK